MNVGKARMTDAVSIQQLVNYFGNRGDLLPRALSEIYENIRDYFVARDGERIAGCAALHVSWADLAEIRSMAVGEQGQHHGTGSLLIKACIEEARQLGIARVFCLTRRPAFFEKHGFKLTDKMELPHKIWAECYHCPKFPNCDEVALTYDIPNVA